MYGIGNDNEDEALRRERLALSGDVFLRAKEGQETNVTVDYTGGCRFDA